MKAFMVVVRWWMQYAAMILFIVVLLLQNVIWYTDSVYRIKEIACCMTWLSMSISGYLCTKVHNNDFELFTWCSFKKGALCVATVARKLLVQWMQKMIVEKRSLIFKIAVFHFIIASSQPLHLPYSTLRVQNVVLIRLVLILFCLKTKKKIFDCWKVPFLSMNLFQCTS